MGINTVKITSAEGIGFAVPINIIKPILESFVNEGKFEEASMGIFAYDKNVIPYLDSNLQFDTGIYVAQVTANSPAARAGLQERDIITKIDGKSLEKMCDLTCYIYTKKPGDVVELEILRKQKAIPITITLGKK